MRGSDQVTGSLFSQVDPEERIPTRHPLRKIRSGRQLMEQMDYNLLFRRFVGEPGPWPQCGRASPVNGSTTQTGTRRCSRRTVTGC